MNIKALALLLLLTVASPHIHAQTRNDNVQDRTARATARQQALIITEQDKRTRAAILQQAITMSKQNTIQDKAVIVDQIRQDKADEAQSIKIASAVKSSADAVNATQDIKNLERQAQITDSAYKIEQIEEQSLTDRQFMIVLTFTLFGVLVAIWMLQHRGTGRLEKIANKLMERTDMLEAHIEETTPWVVDAYKKNLE